jgi:hypothetical protein
MADDISSMTGLPPGKKRHRGGHSGPGHKHLTDLIRAHKSKDYVAAKRHALDLGKALHGHSQGKMESGCGTARCATWHIGPEASQRWVGVSRQGAPRSRTPSVIHDFSTCTPH